MSVDRPTAISVAHLKTERWLLTHVVWRPDPERSGSPETGVRIIGADGFMNFHLIQHGWWNFGMATVVILSRLEVGWDCYRIADFMVNARERRRWPHPSGKAPVKGVTSCP